MREALRDLGRNSWVIGIAAAIAIGYAVVAFLLAAGDAVLEAIGGGEATGPFAFEVAGRPIFYERVAPAAVTLIVVVAAAAFVLERAAHSEETDAG